MKVPFHHDEKLFWYLSSVDYFTKGLEPMLKNGYAAYGGYGRFVQHFWITMKRFLYFNQNAIGEYYMFSQMLLFLAVYFFAEQFVKIKTKIIVITGFLAFLFSQVFISLLFFNI